MPILHVILILAVIAVVVGLILKIPFVPAEWRSTIVIVSIILALLWLLSVFGLLGVANQARVP